MDALPLADARAILRLLGKALASRGTISERRIELVRGLAALIDADVWNWHHTRFYENGRCVPLSALDGGYANDQQRALLFQCVVHPDSEVMLNKPMSAESVRLGHVTRTRRDLVPDPQWYNSDVYRAYRAPSGLDDAIFSVYQLGNDTVSGIGFHRRAGAPPFGDRERCIVHLVLSEIEWLHRAGADVPAAESDSATTPRQNAILLMLLSGDSPKQIARKLRLSVHTVNDHMKALHKHFNVSTRGELLSKFISGGGPRPGA